MREFAYEYADHWLFAPTPLEKAGGLWPIRSGRNRTKPNFKIGPRIIRYYSLHFVLRGEGIVTQGHSTRVLRPGGLFCLFPGVLHQYTTDADRPLELFWFAFDGKQSLPLLHRIGLTSDHYVLENFVDDPIVEAIGRMAASFETDERDDELARMSQAYRLFHRLGAQAVARRLTPERTSNWIEESKQYMDLHYADHINVSEVARRIGVNRSHFATMFARVYGLTPVQYLTELKMRRARRMVAEGMYTFTEIAYTLGYPDLYAFSRAFKKHYGMSPTQARSFGEEGRCPPDAASEPGD